MLAQKISGYGGRALVFDIDPGVELAHGFVIEQLGQRLELLGQLRVRVEVGLTHDRCGGVVREIMLVVFQQLQAERVEATVGGVDQTCKYLPVT